MKVQLLLFAFLIDLSQCANILGVFPLKLKSHYIVFESVMRELVRGGHNVTVLNPFPRSKPLVNFTDIDVSSCYELPPLFDMDVAHLYHSTFKQIPLLTSFVSDYDKIMKCDIVKNLLKTNDSYDLLITELFNADVPLGFAHHFKIPFVLLCAAQIFPWGADRTGNPDNPSYIPYPQTDQEFDRYHPTFYQRLREKAAQAFGPGVPNLSELAKNTSLILTYSHFSITAPIPLVPNIVEIGGVQIENVQPLPEDIQKFINESEHGVIYFCMGSLLKSETLPEAKRIAFLNAFAKLPQRVIWKWGSENLPGKTDNIFIAQWMPQRDILAHPKIKLFIAHGGALGLNEAVYEGVPILGIPMYADQMLNLRGLKAYGAAEILPYFEITNETVLSKIKQVLRPEYSANMKKVSEIYKDRPMSPRDTAMYWINYVIRHKGARHLRSAAADLPFYQYLLLDVIAFILAIIFVIIFSIYYILRKCIALCTKKSVVSQIKKNT